MASASNLPTTRPFTTAATTTTTTAATGTGNKSPSASVSAVRPQPPHLPSSSSSSTFPIFHVYPPPPSHQNIPIRPHQQQQGIIYPVASSGRGFMAARPLRPSSSSDHSPVTIAAAASTTNNNQLPRSVGVTAFRPTSASATSIGSPRSHPLIDSSSGLPHHQHPLYHPVHLMRQHPTHLQHQHPLHHYLGGSVSPAALAPIKGIPVAAPLKAASSLLPVSDSNGYKNTRDRSRDDNLITIRDRKVKISDGASLYALCRSWLRNGFSEENQSHYGDFVKVLPRPLPESDVDAHSPEKEGENEVEVEENEDKEEPVDNLSEQDLLRRHIKRAKKVRARLRERRLKRIARYKTRLAMLLPPPGEQFRNDAAAGN